MDIFFLDVAVDKKIINNKKIPKYINKIKRYCCVSWLNWIAYKHLESLTNIEFHQIFKWNGARRISPTKQRHIKAHPRKFSNFPPKPPKDLHGAGQWVYFAIFSIPQHGSLQTRSALLYPTLISVGIDMPRPFWQFIILKLVKRLLCIVFFRAKDLALCAGMFKLMTDLPQRVLTMSDFMNY